MREACGLDEFPIDDFRMGSGAKKSVDEGVRNHNLSRHSMDFQFCVENGRLS